MRVAKVDEPSPGELGGVLNKILEAEPAAAVIEKAEPETLGTAASGAAEAPAKPKSSRWKTMGKKASSSKDLLGDEDAAPVRNMWQTVRSSGFKSKLAMAAMFSQNDDANEKEVKQAIKDAQPALRLEEIAITTMLKGLAQLHQGEMHGLDYRFKTELSLFRKVMARLDKMTADAAIDKDVEVATPAAIVSSIHDALRYTVVFRTRVSSQTLLLARDS